MKPWPLLDPPPPLMASGCPRSPPAPPPMKTLLLFALLVTATLHAQNEGLWEGYNGEWSHTSRQLLALAEATPPEKFSWRPAPGVRSIGEVYMHIAITNFYLLSVTGPKEPAVEVSMEKTVTQKSDVIDWLKRSLDAVATARAQLKPADYQRKVRHLRQSRHRRWHVPAHHRSRQRAHGAIHCLCAHERHRPAVVKAGHASMQETQTPFALALISGYPGPWPRFASSSRH